MYVFIIDGTELKTQIASDRSLRRAMWSEYKHAQTYVILYFPKMKLIIVVFVM